MLFRLVLEAMVVALISMGNTLRGDDGIASFVCDALPKNFKTAVERFDLEVHSGLLASCLRGKSSAIILDAIICSGTNYNAVSEVGRVVQLDLRQILNRNEKAHLSSSHGISILDELLLVKKQETLPEQLDFFGIEIENSDFGTRISTALLAKVPSIVAQLIKLIQSMSAEILPNA